MQHDSDAPETTSTFKRDDAASYDGVTDDFERFTERFSRPLAERLIALARVSDGARVLDVGCGTGVVTRLVAQRLPGTKVTGIDLSEGMLSHAAALSRAEGLDGRVTFLRQDAESLDLPDGSFDSVLTLFALRHFPDPQRALAEMRRVARPGATVVVAVGSAPPLLSVGAFEAGLRTLLELPRRMAGRAPLLATAFLDGMLDQYLGPAPSDKEAAWTHGKAEYSAPVAGLMREVGYRAVRTTWIGQSSEIESVADFWRLQATFSSRARKRLPLAPREDVANLRRAFDDACERHRARGGQLVYRSGALVALGTS